MNLSFLSKKQPAKRQAGSLAPIMLPNHPENKKLLSSAFKPATQNSLVKQFDSQFKGVRSLPWAQLAPDACKAAMQQYQHCETYQDTLSKDQYSKVQNTANFCVQDMNNRFGIQFKANRGDSLPFSQCSIGTGTQYKRESAEQRLLGGSIQLDDIKEQRNVAVAFTNFQQELNQRPNKNILMENLMSNNSLKDTHNMQNELQTARDLIDRTLLDKSLSILSQKNLTLGKRPTTSRILIDMQQYQPLLNKRQCLNATESQMFIKRKQNSNELRRPVPIQVQLPDLQQTSSDFQASQLPPADKSYDKLPVFHKVHMGYEQFDKLQNQNQSQDSNKQIRLNQEEFYNQQEVQQLLSLDGQAQNQNNMAQPCQQTESKPKLPSLSSIFQPESSQSILQMRAPQSDSDIFCNANESISTQNKLDTDIEKQMEKLGVSNKVQEIKRLKKEIVDAMEHIRVLKSTESMIQRLKQFSQTLDTAQHIQENKKQLSFHFLILNEYMKLLVGYQKKQKSYHHMKSILQHKQTIGEMSDFDDITKNLIHSYFQESSLNIRQSSLSFNDIESKQVQNQNDILILKLDKIKESSQKLNQQLLNDDGIDQKYIDEILCQIKESILENEKIQQMTTQWAKITGDDTSSSLTETDIKLQDLQQDLFNLPEQQSTLAAPGQSYQQTSTVKTDSICNTKEVAKPNSLQINESIMNSTHSESVQITNKEMIEPSPPSSHLQQQPVTSQATMSQTDEPKQVSEQGAAFEQSQDDYHHVQHVHEKQCNKKLSQKNSETVEDSDNAENCGEEGTQSAALPVVQRKRREIFKCPHTDRQHYAKNMCHNCYHRKGKSKMAYACGHPNRSHYSRGMCQNCYLAKYYIKRKQKQNKKLAKREQELLKQDEALIQQQKESSAKRAGTETTIHKHKAHHQ